MEDNNDKIDNLFGQYFKSVDYDPLTAEEQNTLVKKLIDEQKKIAKQSSGSSIFDILKRFFFGENNDELSGNFILKPVLSAAVLLISIGLTSVIFYKAVLETDTSKDKPLLTGTNNLIKNHNDSSNKSEIINETKSDTVLLAEIKLNYSSHSFMDSKKSDSTQKPDLRNLAIEACRRALTDNRVKYEISKSQIISSWYRYELKDNNMYMLRMIIDLPGKDNLRLSIWEEKAKIPDGIELSGKIDKMLFSKIIRQIKFNYFNKLEKYE
jgi:hypothetical protein